MRRILARRGYRRRRFGCLLVGLHQAQANLSADAVNARDLQDHSRDQAQAGDDEIHPAFEPASAGKKNDAGIFQDAQRFVDSDHAEQPGENLIQPAALVARQQDAPEYGGQRHAQRHRHERADAKDLNEIQSFRSSAGHDASIKRTTTYLIAGILPSETPDTP